MAELSTPRAPWSSRILLAVHVALIVLVCVYSVVAAAQDAVGANIGLAFGGFGLAALGLPWSLVYFLLPRETHQGLLLLFAAAGFGAAINLGLHYYLLRQRARRTR